MTAVLLEFAAMPRTYVILDGLQDPLLGQELSARWASAGFHNSVDVAGQCAWFEGRYPATANVTDGSLVKPALLPLTESDMAAAGDIARAFGLELRDRAGSSFTAANDLAALRRQITYEYKSRFATAVVFGLPALLLHWLGPMLSSAGDRDARAMVYPWLIEMGLTGWLVLAAGWPILWQGGASALHLRLTPDLYTTLLVVVSFVPSALAILAMPLTSQPWLGPAGADSGPTMHIAAWAILLATLQRWLLHRSSQQLAGRAAFMIPRTARLLLGWLTLAAGVCVVLGPRWALSIMLLLPPMLSSTAIGPRTGGLASLLPVAGFACFFLASSRGWQGLQLLPIRTEVAAGFCLMLTLLSFWNWRRCEPLIQA